MRNGLKGLALILLLAVPTLADAVPVSFLLGGQLPETSTQVWAGESWQALLTIDDTPVELTETSALYVADGATYGMVLTIAGLVAVANSVRIEIWNDHDAGIYGGLDSMRFSARGGTSGSDNWFGMNMWWAQQGHDGEAPNAIDSLSLFPQPGGFSDTCFESNPCGLVIGNSNNGAGYLSMENLWVTRLPHAIPVLVPEPGTVGLLGLGLIGLGFMAKRVTPSHKT